ncbi:MAG: membrane dipeptidase [Desulfosarcinaceae bacterium]|nr:membrane dipeptidase [Desulfosarcinaceae bacterium]
MTATRVKKEKWELSERAQRLNEAALFVDVHNHMMFEFAIRHALEETHIFDNRYAPALRKGGINVIATSVGGNSPCVCNLSDDLVFGSFEQIDLLRLEEERSNTFRICHNAAEIEVAVADGKIAVLLAFEGARAMEGRADEESLSMLRTFYRLGLRINCICGGGRTRFADGMGEARADAGLTTFGIKLVEEMNRLGMLVDLTHMTDNSFFDVLAVTNRPVLVSHIGVQAVCPSATNLSDDRIRAIGANGGVIGMEMVKTEIRWRAQETGETVTFDDVVRHIDHIAGLIGTDHIGIGLDFDNFDLVHNIHRAMCPAPGTIEGFYTGVPKGNHMLNDPSDLSEAYLIAEYLVQHGYSDDDIRKILGGNMMRLFRETLV